MKNLFKSLAEFQQEVKVIHKATQGYGYSYTDLPKIFSEINPLMKKHGLGFTQLINTNEGHNYLVTILFHVESGEVLESSTLVPIVQLNGMNEYQCFGSGITYFRRYCLSSILGLVTDKDTDASGEQEKHEPKKPAIDNKRFLEALKSIQQGDFTVDKLKEKFELTKEQTNAINEL
jgi:hypothetical protein